MARVTVNVTARDLTGPQLQRMRGNFNNLGRDMDRAVTQRSRQNFQRLSQSITQTRRDLTAMRGSIPEDEFLRMDNAIRRAQNRMQRGFRRTNLTRVAADVRRVTDGFRDLDRSSQIRVRVDRSALLRADARLDAWRRMQGRNAVRVPVRPDVRSGGWRRRLTMALTSPARAIGRLVGGTLSDGIGQGIANGFRGVGPVMGAALVAAIGAVLTVSGAALAGLLVTALGAAFVGIGGVSAAMSDEVKSHWSKTLESLKKDFASVGEPMIPVLNRAMDKLKEMSNEHAPKLKKAIEDTVPATEKFIDGLLKGFERFGAAAFQPIMDAWNVFAPVFAEVFGAFMEELGNSFKEMANLVKEHPTEIAMALDTVFEALDLLVDTVTFLGKVWVFTMQNMFDAVGVVVKGIRFLAEAGLTAFEGILFGAKTFVDFIPGMEGSLDGAVTAFSQFKDNTLNSLTAMEDAAFGWDDALNQANRKRRLEADISTYQAQLKRARDDMAKTTSQKAKAKLEADITDLYAKDLKARSILASLNGKTATVTINTYYQTYGAKPPLASAGRLAHGGVRGLSRAATGGIRSNMTMVGEQGPELIDLAPGSRVRSNPDSRRLVSQRTSGGEPMQVNLVVDGRTLARVLVDPLRGQIRDGGGNVQQYLGQRGRG